MSYLVLARKWRPQTFTDLVGQSHVSRTLENAISQNRVAHAFLFTGVRGVGKTTSARILAKALNCQKGPTTTPCLQCQACVDIAAGTDIDVQEIDGASYNGVDEVRRLQESLPYRPQRDRFKIFIVDEVHMLSQSAWNAFLKTLEEPPPHVKFIFATTEVHKVPITILSRCQRYDFKMIPAQMIAARLRYVLEQEAINADDSTVSLLAREASGSMRDAMSLLDQAIAWGGTDLVGEEVARVLGVASRSVLHEVVHALVEGRAEDCLNVIGQLVEQGYDLPHVARSILAHLRDLVVAKVCKEPGSLLDLADHERADVQSLAERAETDDLIRLHQGFSRSFDDIVRAGLPRAALEMTLVRLARRPALVPLDELMSRLGDLARRLSGGPPTPTSPPAARSAPNFVGGGSPARTGNFPRSMPSPGTSRSSAVALDTTPVSSAEAIVRNPVALAPAAAPAPRVLAEAAPTLSVPQAAPASFSPPSPVRVPSPLAAQEARPSRGSVTAHPQHQQPPVAAPLRSPSRPQAIEANPSSGNGRVPSPGGAPARVGSPRANMVEASVTNPIPGRVAVTRTQALEAPKDSPLPLASARPGVAMDRWKAIVDKVRTERPALASVLELAVPLTLDGSRVVLGFPSDSFLVAQASEPHHTELLTRAVRDEMGQGAAVSIELTAEAKDGLTLARINAAAAHERRLAAWREVESHPLVRAAQEALGAQLQEIHLSEENG